MDTSRTTLESVAAIIGSTLGIEDRVATFGAQTRLLGALPELDSFAVVEIANALEEHFQFEIDETEFTADVFETLGSLAEFVDASRSAS
jgi:acyl carrier protein